MNTPQQQRWLIAGVACALVIIAAVMGYRSRTAPQREHKKPTGYVAPVIHATDPQRGPDNAPLTVFVYADFGCDSCATAWPTIRALERETGVAGKIKFVWKDYPSHKNVFPESVTLHRAARCAQAHGKFWEFQAAAFDHVFEIRNRQPVLKKVLTETGLTPADVQSCIDSPAVAALVQQSYDEARASGVTATPTFIARDKKYEGSQNYPMFAGGFRNMIAQMEYEHAQRK